MTDELKPIVYVLFIEWLTEKKYVQNLFEENFYALDFYSLHFQFFKTRNRNDALKKVDNHCGDASVNQLDAVTHRTKVDACPYLVFLTESSLWAAQFLHSLLLFERLKKIFISLYPIKNRFASVSNIQDKRNEQ